MKKLLSNNFLIVTLFISFYVLHQWNRFYQMVEIKSVIFVWISLFMFSFICYFFSKFFYKSKDVACFFIFILFFFLLYFSLFETFVDSLFDDHKSFAFYFYIFLLLFLVLVVIFKRVKHIDLKILIFFKVLFLTLFLVDAIYFFIQITGSSNLDLNDNVKVAPNIKLGISHSVYLIVLDEYSGSESLKKGYGFSNDSFLKELELMQFHTVRNAKSNYKHTVFSMASVLNGCYLYKRKSQDRTDNFSNSLQFIYTNSTFKNFSQLGYQIYNLSPFQIEGYSPYYQSRFLPSNGSLILSSSIFPDLYQSFPYYFAKLLKSRQMILRAFEKNISTNSKLLNKLSDISKLKESKPVFVYLHLQMPHAPYLFDSTGRVNFSFLLGDSKNRINREDAYLQYLIYTNKLMLSFLNDLKANTNGDAVIVLMSDHGCKDFNLTNNLSDKFNCLNSIYYPKNDTSGWYDGMSNVNQFRILFSKLTGQSIPLLHDSTISNIR